MFLSHFILRLTPLRQRIPFQTTYFKMSFHRKRPSVAILIIGDEILKGQTQDTNSHFLMRRFFKLGVKVEKISVIADELEAIANEVRLFSDNFDYVITTGGIGPTHDDKTFEGIALAFQLKLCQNHEILEICNAYIKKTKSKDLSNEAILKMSYIPSTAELKYPVDAETGKTLRFPVVVVKNVYIFPGIPSLLERAFLGIEEIFRNSLTQLHHKQLYFSSDELTITNTLTEADNLFHDRVVIGSYPDPSNPYYKVKVTLEASNENDISDVVAFFKDKISPNCFTHFDPQPLINSETKVYHLASTETELGRCVRKSLDVIEEAFTRYSFDETIVGFNGGKDCTAVLHLVHAVIQKLKNFRPLSTHTSSPQSSLNGKLSPSSKGDLSPGATRAQKKFNVLFIQRGKSFPEMELFVKQTIGRYPITSVVIEGQIKEGLCRLKEEKGSVKGVFMGTRRTDPGATNLAEFQMTDKDWPEFMRINPILDWSYAVVWDFIRQLSLAYCPLYDVGYTSLGSIENTHPNLALRAVDERGVVFYRPAYYLRDSMHERSGRN